jgi:Ca-activated chloride channel homolog
MEGNTLINAATGRPIDLAMQHLDLSGRVSPAGALLRATHTFKPVEGGKPLEAIYTFMLPRNGVVRRFVVKGENFEVESNLKERAEARKEYEEGIQQGHLSVLAETSLDGMVTLQIGQVRPGELVTVMVECVCGVDLKDTTYRFRFPFTLAPSYHSKAKTTATPTGGKMELPQDVFGDLILPEWKNSSDGLHQVSFNMNVEAPGPIASVGSSSHRIVVTNNEDGTAQVTLASGGDLPNRDLVLDVTVKAAAPMLFADKLDEASKLPEDAPRWTALVPSSVVSKTQAAPRHVVFLIDRSGSMSGQPLASAKKGVLACLSSLDPTDQFGLLDFGSDTRMFHKSLVPASDANRKQALRYTETIDAHGGTELARALAAAVEVLGGDTGDIFLLTDGDVFHTGPIIDQMVKAKIRVHILGINTASQDRFMSQLARRCGGISKTIGPREDVSVAALELFNTARKPLRMNTVATVTLADGKTQKHSIETIWENRPVLITDNGTTGKAHPVKVDLGGDIQVVLDRTVTVQDGLNALLWAGRRVEDLETTLDANGSDGPVGVLTKAELKEVSTKYGLASRVMSLVSVIKRVGDVAGTQMDQKVVAVGTPEDVSASGVFGQAAAAVNYVGPGVYCATAAAPASEFLSYSLCCDTDTDDSSQMNFAPQNYGASNIRVRSATRGGSTTKGMTKCSDRLSADLSYEPTKGVPISSRGGSSTRSLYLRDNQDQFNSLYEVRERGISNSGSVMTQYQIESMISTTPKDPGLIAMLTTLQSDGGLPAGTLEERVLRTAVFALAALQAQIETGTSLYTSHLKKMAKFIEDNAAAVTFLTDEIVTFLRMASLKAPGDWITENEKLSLVTGAVEAAEVQRLSALCQKVR